MLFLMAAGLTLVFGIMNLVNLAHGSLYMVGAYLATAAVTRTGSFLAAVVFALLGTLAIGMLMEVLALRTLYERDHLDQVLATFGLILFFNEAVAIVWGRAALFTAVPSALSGHIQVLPGIRYPAYRAVIIVVGLLVALLLYVVVTRTRLGMLIRAGASNRTMVGALGVNIRLLYTVVFGFGAALAALGGLMAGPIYTVLPGMGEEILIQVFVVIVIVGFGGMVSFGHAAYLGIGAYAVAIPAFYGIHSGLVQWPLAMVLSGLAALAIGAVSLRTSGVSFIMITLAFAQMLYYLGISINAWGADDGMRLARRSQFGGVVDLTNGYVFYYVVLGVLVALLALGHRLVHARFGVVIRAAKSNEPRMRAIGFSTFRYKLAAFVIAGAVGGLAGALLTNQTEYLTPSYMHWTRSGDIMVMVILGGMGTLYGPVLGAVVFLLLEDILSAWTVHWQVVLGPLLVLVVLYARRGLWSLLPGAIARDG